MFDITKDRITLKKDKQKQKMRISQIKTIIFFKNFCFFCRKTYLEKFSLFCYVCISDFSHGRLLEKHNNKTSKPTQLCIGFLYTVLRFKILGNRLGILT